MKYGICLAADVADGVVAVKAKRCSAALCNVTTLMEHI